MNVVDWSHLDPTAHDLHCALQSLGGATPPRTLLKALVQAVLDAYPWDERTDCVAIFDPARTYLPGERAAFPLHDRDGLRPDTWQIGQVRAVEPAENPLQGAFQVVTVQVGGSERAYAAGIPSAQPLSLAFPPEDAEDTEWLVGDIVGTYGGELETIVRQAVEERRIAVVLHGDRVVPARALRVLDGPARTHLGTILAASLYPIAAADLLAHLRQDGLLGDLPDDAIAIIVLERFLDASPDYCSLGGGRWMTQEQLEKLDRAVDRRPLVPIIPSEVAAKAGEDDDALWSDYDEVELVDADAQQALAELGEEEVVRPSLEEWRRTASAGPLRLPPLTYQQILEGFLPLNKAVAPAFFPGQDPLWVDIQVIRGEPLHFLVSWAQRLIKAVDQEQFRRRFLDADIPAGTDLWLERQGDFTYRVAPRPLPRPRRVRCKQASPEQGQWRFQEVEIEMRYEGSPHLFKAELRFGEVEALFAEAQALGWSIADCLYHIFPELSPAGEPVHYTELFNAVFFRCRMCSPRSVIAELYNRPCFVPQGDGYFRFEKERGFRRPRLAGQPRPRPAPASPIPALASGPRTSVPRPEADDAWRHVRTLEGHELHTLDHGKPFRVLEVTPTVVRIRVLGTGLGRTIERWRIEDAWRQLLEQRELTRVEIRERFSQFNPAYVAAILSAMPGVTHEVRPIRLHYGLASSPPQPPTPTPGRTRKDPPVAPAPAPPSKTPTAGEPPTPAGRTTPLPLEPSQSAGPATPPPAEPPPEPTRTGQRIMPGVVPPGPLFEETPTGATGTVAPEEPADAAAIPATELPGGPPVPPSPPVACKSRAGPATPKRGEMQTKALFSQHYLDTRLPEHPEWEEDPLPILEAVRRLWQKARQYGDSWNEAQTEREFVQPVLEALGWAFIVQPKSTHQGRVNRPDYALFADQAAKEGAYLFQGRDDPFYSRALAIAEAKYWGRPLSQKDASGRDAWKAGANPSYQMVGYLVGTGVPWGILTNGLTWRLYSREASSTASEFYEVDLGVLFDFLLPGAEPTAEQLDQFRRWWLFFRRDAFLPDAHGKSFVQLVHEGSTTYARDISDKLKELVFGQVMPEIAGGFVAYRYHERGVREETEESLRQVYQASLSLLYKLLFVLYAEARSLLPVQNTGYQEQSLTALAQWSAQQLDGARPLSTTTHAAPRYDALLGLFHRIDRGDPGLGIPRYNGGLFNRSGEENRFLEEHKLSDRAVAVAVDTLVRDAGQPVDYAYISVRNLGAIYEGLLENRLHVVDAAQGQVELVNDKGERKASGSYYTPDYIVEYIVRHTLDPLLEERNAQFRAAMDRCADHRRRLQQDAAGAPVLRQELDDAERDAREAFLGLKVLDPAMGSGHFLVNAVDHLTDGIIQRMQAYHDGHPDALWEWNPIQRLIERVRGEIVAEMAAQGIPLEEGRLEDTALLTRLVMKRCIYGVDLNRMAVELAKLSLWLHSFTVGAPLSFLNHHLRWGNSLIGATVREVEQAMRTTEHTRAVSHGVRMAAKGRGERVIEAVSAQQHELFAGPFAGLLELTGLMIEVVERADTTLADVRQSAELYEQLQQQLKPYKQALDLWVGQYFGNAGGYEFLTLHGPDVLPALRGEQPMPAAYQEAIRQAQVLWQERRLFHWDLEFPEAFVDLHRRDWAESPGFDAVVGNPPYVSVTNIEPGLRSYLLSEFRTATGRFDLYIIFNERAFSLLRQGGNMGFIQPIKFGVFANGKLLRTILLEQTRILHIVDVSQSHVFPDPSTYPCLLIARKCLPDSDHRIMVIQPSSEAPETIVSGDTSAITVESIPQSRFQETPEHVFCLRLSDRLWAFVKQVSKLSCTIGDLFEIEQCIRIGSAEKRRQLVLDAHRYSSAPSEIKRICKRMLDGQDIERYAVEWDGIWLQYIPKELYNPKSSEVLDVPKILVKRIAPVLTVFPDTGHDGDFFYPLNTVYALIAVDQAEYSLYYVAGLLNSVFLDWYYKLMFETIAVRGGYIEYREYMRYLPIRRISFVTPAGERARRGEEGKRLVNGWITDQRTEPAGPGPVLSADPLETSADQSFPHFAAWLEARLSPVYTPDPALVRQHNADPRHAEWQLPEAGLVEQADVVHDLLAHLAEQMIAMNREKQAEVKGFLEWLERECGVPLGELTGASRLRSYIGDYQKDEPHLALEDVLEILRKNRRRLRADPSDRGFQERLRKEYEDSLGKLLPLKARLAATDRLIDLIVFRLYGLTEEEVAVVEGSSTSAGVEPQE